MNDEEFKVKDLIKYLADFNPNAIITDKIDIAWAASDYNGVRDIEKEKANTERVTLCYPGGCEQ